MRDRLIASGPRTLTGHCAVRFRPEGGVKLPKPYTPLLRKVVRFFYSTLRRLCSQHPDFQVLLFPEGNLDSDDQVSELITKLRWYLPDNRARSVVIHYINSGTLVSSDSHDWLGSYQERKVTPQHHQSLAHFRKEIRFVNLILVWNKDDVDRAKEIARPGEKVVNVDKHDPESQEYGKLASLSWDHVFPRPEKDKLLNRSLDKLRELREDWRTSYPTASSLVATTGPSYSIEERIDSSGALVIACNSIVSDPDFFQRHNPLFFVFGDGAHHAGASKPAQAFREDLRDRLIEFPDFYVVTTDKFAGVLEPMFSDHWDRFLFFRQSGKRKPAVDLTRQRTLPSYDSVLTIHMLPLAYTFTERIFLIGTDGINPNGDNEDFWAHEKKFRYGDAVGLVHRAHPTFEYHRSVRLRDLPPTHIRFEAGLDETLRFAEIIYKKRNFSLTESFTKPVQDRFLRTESNGTIRLSEL